MHQTQGDLEIMINLLPVETKRQIGAARANTVLMRYLVFIGISSLLMVAIFGGGLYITLNEKKLAAKDLDTLKQSNSQYSPIQKQAEEFSANLGTAKSILSNEIIFSELTTNIAKALPVGTVLTNLTILTDNVGQPITLNARTKDEEGALRLKNALETSPVFEKVSISSITSPIQENEGSNAAVDTISRDYPYTVTINATLSKENPTAATTPNGGSN